jgi:NAD(P)-dependent dehydrogenase (short-subunit alcohol dehydrogenase family)
VTRLAIVTGVLGAIGWATAEAFGQAGWRVIGIDRRAADPASALDSLWHLDLGDPGVDRQLADRMSAVGPISAVVNNAALQVERALVETDIQDWDQVMASNVRGAYLTIKHAHPGLRAAHGAVVNVSSVHAAATSPGLAAYVTSKGALTALTRAAALELAPDGIRVNAVLPGAIDSPMLRQGITARSVTERDEDDLLAPLARRIPLARVGLPAEVAQAILFLADSERSAYITGQTLVVDGGALARLSSE